MNALWHLCCQGFIVCNTLLIFLTIHLFSLIVICISHLVCFGFRGQAYKDTSCNENPGSLNNDEIMQDEMQGEITESIGGLYEIPEPVVIESVRTKLVS